MNKIKPHNLLEILELLKVLEPLELRFADRDYFKDFKGLLIKPLNWKLLSVNSFKVTSRTSRTFRIYVVIPTKRIRAFALSILQRLPALLQGYSHSAYEFRLFLESLIDTAFSDLSNSICNVTATTPLFSASSRGKNE